MTPERKPPPLATSTDPSAPFVRSNLREQIKDVILERIISGEYAPGGRIVETRIAQELNVSQTSVREALRDLEQLGCVVHEPFRGCSVRAFSTDELLQAFPVRAALEALGAGQAAELITDDQLDRLAELIEAMRDAAKRGDARGVSDANAEFHATILRAARNPTLERQWSFLEPYSRTFISMSRPGMDLGAQAGRHVPILEALRKRDPAAAHAAMHEHLMSAAEILRATIDNHRAEEGSA